MLTTSSCFTNATAKRRPREKAIIRPPKFCLLLLLPLSVHLEGKKSPILARARANLPRAPATKVPPHRSAARRVYATSKRDNEHAQTIHLSPVSNRQQSIDALVWTCQHHTSPRLHSSSSPSAISTSLRPSPPASSIMSSPNRGQGKRQPLSDLGLPIFSKQGASHTGAPGTHTCISVYNINPWSIWERRYLMRSLGSKLEESITQRSSSTTSTATTTPTSTAATPTSPQGPSPPRSSSRKPTTGSTPPTTSSRAPPSPSSVAPKEATSDHPQHPSPPGSPLPQTSPELSVSLDH